jgi:hypothetical protein
MSTMAKPLRLSGYSMRDGLWCYIPTKCDLGDGWEDIEVHKDPQEVREKALKMGANIIRYIFQSS